MTLGTGEGGNAFGDRFFIRGFDARNDIFIDGIRDRRRQRPRKLLHRAGRNPAWPGLVLCRPRHRRRRHQHRHQAGDDRKSFYNMDTHVRHRPHQARRARRQPGDQPDAGDSRRRPVPGRQRRRPQLRQGRSRGRLHRGQVDAARRHQDARELHPHRPARPAGFRRAVLSAGSPRRHYRHGRRPVHRFRRQPQQLVWLRQSRHSRQQAGHRHARRRGHDHRQI